MKLLSCRISNFGKLQNATIDFQESLTVIKQDNSFGKSTLANFILSMFYGLPDLRVQDLSNDRRRYEPWQGGIFGGSLTFEYGGIKYQIDRDFNKNLFNLMDITSLTKKTVNTINGKAVDGNNLGEVLFEINKNSFRRSAYIPQDEIICSEIESDLNDKLRNLINATDEKHSLSKALATLQKAAEVIETKRGKGKLLENEMRINELRNSIEECKICLENAEIAKRDLQLLTEQKKGFGQKLQALQKQINEQTEIDTLSAQQKHYGTLTNNIKKCEYTINALLPFFNGQDTDNIDLGKIKQKIESFKLRQKAFKDKEDETFVERGKLLNMEEASLARQERKNTLNAQVETISVDKQRAIAEKESAKGQINELLTERKKSKGILFILLCVISLGIFYFVSRKKQRERESKIALLQNTVNECESKLAEYDGKIAEIKLQIDDINNKNSGFDSKRFENLKQELAKEQLQVDELKGEVAEILSAFNCLSMDFTECYHEIFNKTTAINKAKTELEENKSALQNFMKDKDKAKLFAEISTEVSIEQLNDEKQQVNAKLIECVKDIAEKENYRNANEDKAADISDYQSQLLLCEENKDILTEELAIIKETINFLKEAGDNLANQYLIPLLDKSSRLIEEYDGEKSLLAVDSNFKIFIKEDGKDRAFDYYSKGIKEVISISLRIALIDIIFESSAKKPFLILDDPFVNFDDTKLEKAKNFIKNLSKSYQIIYLTCHDSRKILV